MREILEEIGKRSAIVVVEAALETGEGLAREFLNDPGKHEWHALSAGFTAGWLAHDQDERFSCSKIPDWYPAELRSACEAEFPYYNGGWWIGWNADSLREYVGEAIRRREVQIGGALMVLIIAYSKARGLI